MSHSIKRSVAGAGAFVAVMAAGVPGAAIAAAVPDLSPHHPSHSRDDGQPGADRHGRQGRDRGTREAGSAARPVPPAVAGRVVPASESAQVALVSVEPRAVASPPVAAVIPARRGDSSISRVRVPTPHASPVVTFGNGRSPRVPAGRPAPQLDAVEPPLEPAPVEPSPPASAIVAPSAPTGPASIEPAPLEPPATAPRGTFVGDLQPGWPAGVLFGIAGLILAPIGGVWLGHRQARAAKSASQLVSR